ncbi:kinase-like protein [Testicularia cyperi]|uniref:Kinase-like protein n=1 Tax=Testicularia cyperi TaxID=1882483 RepID=A0A317XHJ5_9BASI|nr:kinase-like protein [Testicularia cyperi]
MNISKSCSDTDWPSRRSAIIHTLSLKAVRAAIRDFQINKTDNDLNDTVTNDVASQDQTQRLDELLDIALTIAWSCDGLQPHLDPNPLRAAAVSAIASICKATLQVHDFKTVRVLQKGAGSLVEVVRCRIDGQIYVLKSLVKGFARRNAAIQTPINEARLLQRPSDSEEHGAIETSCCALTPHLMAAFQTQNSVHVLMEYLPSGDFCELLMAASNCGAEYPGRASTGLLTEDWIFRYSVDMVQAIAWVHSQGYVHRDIKPGNFLLDRSGHLKLCDFASAAPFSSFEKHEPGTTNHAGRSRKVWKFFCSQPTGTCDYLSPEVLEAEEMRMLERQQSFQSLTLEAILSTGFGSSSSTTMPQPNDSEAREPGPYGPELDWWSFGIILYEMRFGVLPFFADKMGQTYELIKNHRHTLKLDSTVQCSAELTSLIRRLLTTADARIGRNDSREVQQHSFFEMHKVDWSRDWPVEPPFVPNQVSSEAADAANPALRPLNLDASLSAVSSLPSFSALFAGHPDDFPAFADSRDLDRSLSRFSCRQEKASESNDAVDEKSIVNLSSLPRSSSSPAVVLKGGSPSPLQSDRRSEKLGSSSPSPARNAPRWSDCDVSFVGFSRLPPHDAFMVATGAQEARTGHPSSAQSYNELPLELTTSPGTWPASTPLASTPFVRSTAAGSSHALPTPPSFAPSPVALKQLDVGRLNAGQQRQPSGSETLQPHNYVTPARKPSYMVMHERFKQARETQQEPAISESTPGHQTPAVPQSPYPFPAASVARTAKFTEGKKAILHRRDLDRARSATPGGGGSVGSESRQSGGSNAVREISEREAWDEMMMAVQKSIRKKQNGVAPLSAVSSRPPSQLPRSTTDPQLSSSKPASTFSWQDDARSGAEPQHDGRYSTARRALHDTPAPSQITSVPVSQHQSEMSADPMPQKPNSGLSRLLGQQASRTVLVAPRPTVRLPSPGSPSDDETSAGCFPHGSSNRLHVPSHHALDIDMYDSDDSDGGDRAARPLRHKKSARQLLIRAQERGTPTKPNRTQSPSLTDGFSHAPPVSSVAARWETTGARASPPLLLSGDNNSIHSLSSSRDDSYDHAPRPGFAGRRTRPSRDSFPSLEAGSANASTEVLSGSLPKTSISFAPITQVPVLGAIAPLHIHSGRSGSMGESTALSAAARDVARARALRRKDSGEMLSQYRRGMGRATSMMSLSSQAKADAARDVAMTSSSPPPDNDDFILGHVGSRIRNGLSNATSSSQRALRRFSARTVTARSPTPGDRPKTAAVSTRPATSAADVSVMTGLDQRHHALQGSLSGLEQRLATIKARLEK